MAQFIYNKAKNEGISYSPLKFKYEYHPGISFEDEINPQSKPYFANKLAKELRELIEIYG